MDPHSSDAALVRISMWAGQLDQQLQAAKSMIEKKDKEIGELKAQLAESNLAKPKEEETYDPKEQ